jgi:hypothetical protein
MPVAAIVVAWVPLVLGLDSISGRSGQLLLGLLSWVLLAVLLRRQDPLTRVSVLIVVAYATLIEYTFSAFLGTYTYRLPGVPAFVPPGHGLVYLAALCLGRSRAFRARPRALVIGASVAVAAYALWGLLLSPRLDVLGALWAACLLWFLWRGRAPLVYVGAFLVVTYLEILGTSIGTWTWGTHDPVLHWIAIGNPPSGAAGGYGFFDAAALALAPGILALLRRMRPVRPEPVLELELTEAA